MKRYILVGFILSLLYSSGWDNLLIGVRPTSLAGAFTAIADDATATFYNPAGLSTLRVREFYPTLFYTLPNHTYRTESEEFHSKRAALIPNFFLAMPVKESFGLGLSFTVPYGGGGVRWDDEDLNTYMDAALGVTLLTLGFGISIYDFLKVGFGLDYYTGVNDAVLKSRATGESIKIHETGSDFSGRGGFLLKLKDGRLRIGGSIRGPVELKLKGSTTFENTVILPEGTHNSTSRFKLPTCITLGTAISIKPNLTLSLETEYTTWSDLDSIHITIDDVPHPGTTWRDARYMGLKNSLKLKAGLEWKKNRNVIRLGVARDPRGVKRDALSYDNIDVDKYALILGYGRGLGAFKISLILIGTFGQGIEVIRGGREEYYDLDALVIGGDIGVKF